MAGLLFEAEDTDDTVESIEAVRWAMMGMRSFGRMRAAGVVVAMVVGELGGDE